MVQIQWFIKLFWIIGTIYLNLFQFKFNRVSKAFSGVKTHFNTVNDYNMFDPQMPRTWKNYFTFVLGLDLTLVIIALVIWYSFIKIN